MEVASAVQVMIIPISEASVGYAQKVRSMLRVARLHVDVDASDKKMQKKVREAQLAQFNYILVRSQLLPLKGKAIATPPSLGDLNHHCIMHRLPA